MKWSRWPRRLLKPSSAKWWITAWTLLLLCTATVVWVLYPEWLASGESASTTIRNLGLIVAAAAALPLAIWRSIIAERQADAAQRQVEFAQASLLNERYQKGAEMLGSNVLPVRLGGIYALQGLADDHPREYHVQIMRLFCAFARWPTAKDVESFENEEITSTAEHGNAHHSRLRQDVATVMEAIANRREAVISLEQEAEFRLDFRGAILHEINLMNFDHVDFSRANFSFADLSGANLRPSTNMSWGHAVRVHLSGACLAGVDMSMTQFVDADLSDTLIAGANLSGARFSNSGKHAPCKLTQGQLDQSCADPNKPPQLEGVFDVETGKPLVWRGKAVDTVAQDC